MEVIMHNLFSTIKMKSNNLDYLNKTGISTKTLRKPCA